LERRYPRFDGLNLTWETLEGLAKHNGPLTDASGRPAGRYASTGLPFAIAEHLAQQDLWAATHAGPEAQAAAIADDIAYDAHDLDDGLRAGLLDLDTLAEPGVVGSTLGAIRDEYPNLPLERMRAELVRRLISAMIADVVAETRARLAVLNPASADDVRRAGRTIVEFSPAMGAADRGLKAMLHRTVYRHPRLAGVMDSAERAVERMFGRYIEDRTAVPEARRGDKPPGEHHRARRIADFMAGMTDRYAIAEYWRLFGENPGFGSAPV
jgi:dGTPase